MRKNKKRNRGFVKFLAALMLIISMSAAVYLGWRAYSELSERNRGVDYYDDMASAYDRSGGRGETGKGILDRLISLIADDANTDDETTALPAIADMPEANDEAIERGASLIDFDTLRKSCPDVVGWIRLEDTNIDYPIVHGSDNFYYMSHLPNGAPNSAGSIMMDVTNEEDYSDTITILHGHHMRNGNMFGNLEKLAKEGYFEDHPCFHLFTPQGDYNCEVVAGWTASARVSGFPIRFENEESFREFVNYGINNAVYASDTDVRWTDHFVLLSTCAYSFTNARFIVLAKIL